MVSIADTQELLRQRADLQSRLNLLPYDGTPEIKTQGSKKYLYVRKRIAGKLTSKYVDVYSDELYQLLLRNSQEAKELRKQLRHIDKALAEVGYAPAELSPRVMLNIDFARANLKANIYDQAVLEGIATSFPQTEDIIEGGKVQGVSAADVQKVLNLKHAWEFILDKDVLQSKTDFYMLSHIARLVNEGFFSNGGSVRGVPVTIGGSSYVPPIPIESDVKESLRIIAESSKSAIDTAIELCLFCMKSQIFIDGNKRAAIIFANQNLIARGKGLLVVPEKEVPEFKGLLVEYYEGSSAKDIKKFLKEKCWRKL